MQQHCLVPVEEVGPQVQYGGVEENGQQEKEGREEEGSRVEGAEYTSTVLNMLV